MIGRRTVLAGLGALALPWPAEASTTQFLSAHDDAEGASFVARFDARGDVEYDLPLPARGHGITIAPDGRRAVAVARRPGKFLQSFDLATGRPIAQANAIEGYFFCGHAAFDNAGAALFATETREEDGAGFIGVYDARDDFRRLAAWPTQGGDPHELLRLGDELVIANGGFGLDGDPIDPSLVRLDARDGAILAQVRPPSALRQVSLRHMAVAGGAVFVAGQYAGPSHDRPPLVARWDGDGLRFIDLPAPVLGGLANYCGSIAAAADGKSLCTTSPRGGQAIVFTPDGALIERVALADVCGVAAMPRGFLLTGGRGDVTTTNGTRVATRVRWDNHAITVGT